MEPTSVHRRDNAETLLAIGCVTALATAASHEAIGHGLACLAVGGRITLLTTTHFSCLGGSPLVDAAGPAMNLLLAALGAVGFQLVRQPPTLRVFLLTLAIFNTFWFAGEALRSSLSPLDDEAALARTLGWPPIWRFVCFVGAVALFWVGVARFVTPFRESAPSPSQSPTWRAAFLLAGGAAALTFAGACWRRDPANGASEGFLSIAAASAPMLLSARAAARRGALGAPRRVGASILWVGLALSALALFSLTQGRGYGRLT